MADRNGFNFLPIPPVNDNGTISKSVLNQMWRLLRNIQCVTDGGGVIYKKHCILIEKALWFAGTLKGKWKIAKITDTTDGDYLGDIYENAYDAYMNNIEDAGAEEPEEEDADIRINRMFKQVYEYNDTTEENDAFDKYRLPVGSYLFVRKSDDYYEGLFLFNPVNSSFLKDYSSQISLYQKTDNLTKKHIIYNNQFLTCADDEIPALWQDKIKAGNNCVIVNDEYWRWETAT